MNPAMEIALLRHSELFAGLPDADLGYVGSRSSLLRLPSSARLFQSGDPAVRFFVVSAGSVRVFRPRESGAVEVMALFAPGDALGDFDFARGADYDAWAETAEASEILVFPAEGVSLDDLSRERPDVVARIKLRCLAMIAGRLRSTYRMRSENAPWVRELRRQVHEDPGTGLWTRAFLDEEVLPALRESCAFIVLKPRRFKDLVDARGHAAGDAAMVRLAAVLKDLARRQGRGWAIRVRSNETALVVPGLPAAAAGELARTLALRVAAIEPFCATAEFPAFSFSAALAWARWPEDGTDPGPLFDAVHEACLESWKGAGNGPVHARLVPPALHAAAEASAGDLA